MKKIIIGFLLIASLILAGCKTLPTDFLGDDSLSKEDALAQCLTEKEAIMYGTEWCSHCKNQKEAFGNSFQYVNYVDCDKDKQICSNAGIKGYPTWVIDGTKYPGGQPLYKLASLTGCSFEVE